MILNWGINFLLISTLLFFLKKQAKGKPLEKFFFPAILFKLAAGIGVGLLYHFYYQLGGDTFLLFNLSAYLTEIARERFHDFLQLILFNKFDESTATFFFTWHKQPRVLFFVKLLSLVNLLTYSNYWLTSIYLSLFSFFGCWKIANYITLRYPIKEEVAAFAFLFFPAFVFWSSGVLKESIAIGVICLVIPAAIELASKRKVVLNLLQVIFFAYLIIYLKYYYAAVLFPVLFAYLNAAFLLPSKKAMLKYIYFFSALLFLLFLIGMVHPNLMLEYFPKALYNNYVATIKAAGEGDFYFTNFTGTWYSILIHLPKALITGLFRPFIWEAKPNLQLISGIENFILLLLTLTSLVFTFYLRKIHISLSLVACVTYIFILATVLSFSSPNFGSLIRYKTAFIPFFLILIANNNPIFSFFFSRFEIGRKA